MKKSPSLALSMSVSEMKSSFSRRITAMLRRERWRVNRKRVQRLMRESCLLVQIRRLVRTSDYRPGLGNCPNLLKTTAVTRPNQV